MTNAVAGPSFVPSILISAHSLPTSTPYYSNSSTLIAWNEVGQCACATTNQVQILTPYFPLPGHGSGPTGRSAGGIKKIVRPPPPPIPLVLTDTSAVAVPKVPVEHDILPLWIGKIASDGGDVEGPASTQSLGEDEDETEDPHEYLSGLSSDTDVGLTDKNCLLPTSHAQAHLPSIIALAWSPIGLSEQETPVLAVLDAALRLTVRAPVTDWVCGGWKVISDLGIEAAALSEPSSVTNPDVDMEVDGDLLVDKAGLPQKTLAQRQLEIQYTSISWSSIPSFSPPPSGPGKPVQGSLLAVGSRSGELSFWAPVILVENEMNNGFKMERKARKQLCSTWITSLSWSPWTLSEEEGQEQDIRVSYLAFGTSEGGVGLVPISISMVRSPHGQWEVNVGVGEVMDLFDADCKGLTGLKWVHDDLIFTKAGITNIYSSATGEITKHRLLKLGKWAGTSSLSPCAGITPLPYRSVLVSLHSGEQHVFHLPATIDPENPTVSTYDEETSRKFTKAMKKAFEEIDPEKSDVQASARVRGFAGLGCEVAGGSVIFSMLHEPLYQHDLSYPREADRVSWVSLMDFSGLISAPPGWNLPIEAKDLATDQSPSSILLSFLPKIFRTEQNLPNPSLSLPLASPPTSTTPRMQNPFKGITDRQILRSILNHELTHRPEMMGKWMNVTWSQWQDVTNSPEPYPLGDSEFDMSAASQLHEHVFRVLIFYLAQAVLAPGFDINSISSVLKRISQIATDTTALAGEKELGAALQKLKTAAMEVEDTCPVCDEIVPFVPSAGEDQSSAVCGMGHKWVRCALTLQLVTSTPTTRTCTICQRKILSPSEKGDQGPIVQDVLQAVSKCCPWCGGRWKILV